MRYITRKLIWKLKYALRKLFIPALIFAAAVLYFSGRAGSLDNMFAPDTASAADNLDAADLVRVVDGDTIVVRYGGTEERVRLIGVDTPESVHPDRKQNEELGKLASDFTKETLSGVKTVYLEFDVEIRDKYDRLLCYVYWNRKGEQIMLNRYLVQQGYANTLTIPPNVKYKNEFRKDLKEAQEAKRGLWAD